MLDYLNANATFKCTLSPLVNFTLDEGNTKVTYNGRRVLTDTLKLIGTGACAPLTMQAGGVPVPCCCNLGKWIAPEMKVTAAGHKLLTQLSTNICQASPTPSMIVVANSGVLGGLCKGVALPGEMSASAIAASQSSTSNTNPDPKSQSPNQNPDQKSPTPNRNSDQKSPTPNRNSDLETPSSSQTSAEAVADQKPKFRCARCKQKCDYRMEGDPNEHFKKPIEYNIGGKKKISNPKKLDENYLKYLGKIAGLSIDLSKLNDETFCRNLLNAIAGKCTDADRYYVHSLIRRCELIDKIWGHEPWTYAAHHIIPGEQVFKNIPKLYYVSGLCIKSNEESSRVFNVNEAMNCIMLLMRDKSTKYDSEPYKVIRRLQDYHKKLPKFIRELMPPDERSSFDRMVETEAELEYKIQWHETQHKYSFKLQEADMLASAFPGKKLEVYSPYLQYRLEMLIERNIDLENICAREVRSRLIGVIEDVRQHLADFAIDPKRSYPYYVTKVNYFYTVQEG